ncbi:ABC transporter ATP-binding protein [Paraburkholderia nodosa]|uniref:ABC transporter ATP-binding protein n=1 Tax=Paraburkholderia nodosa TaxID=392320 RepID=UPI00084201E0|nr:ABC transporter ATP-binding protein [Paraburkholderia nodosa]
MSEILTSAATPASARLTGRTLVDVRGLSIGFADVNGGGPLVRGVDLTIHAGECVALVGESGSGKSLTARSLIGLAGTHARIDAQRFEIDGRAALEFRERDWRAVRGGFAGLVMQDALVSLDPLRTVGREIGETLARHAKRQSRAQRAAAVHAVMRDVGIPEPERRAAQYAHELSGGQRQRIVIARAIASEPALIVCDEPVSALDVYVQAQVLDLLGELQARLGTALLFISHDLDVVQHVSDRVLVLKDGRAVETGATAEVFSAPQADYTKRLLRSAPTLQTQRRAA